MLYQIDVDVTGFNKYKLQDIYSLKCEREVKLHCLDDTFIKSKLVESKGDYYFVGYYDNEFLPKSMYDKAIVSLYIEFEYEEHLNIFTHIPVDKIMTTKYSDFDGGEYLVVMINLKSYEISLEILETFENYTAIAGCFGFDVEKEYKILSYVKIRSK